MQIKSSHTKLSQPIIVALFAFLGSFTLTTFLSHSFTPAGDSQAASDVNVELQDVLSLAILDKDPTVDTTAAAIDTIAMTVTPSADGTFISSTAYVQAGSNNETGYTLSFSDTDNTTALTHQDATATITTLASATTDKTAANFPANQWGYSFGSDTLSTAYNPVPALATPVTLASPSDPGSSVYPFTVATKINTGVPSGTYSDTVVFSLVANFVPAPHAISFNKNETSYNPITSVAGDTIDPVELKYNKNVTLPVNTYSRLGYRFLGWDEDATATEPTYEDAARVNYASLSGDTVTLYAIWQPKNFPSTLTTMQGMTSDICADVYTPTANTTTINSTDQYFSADNVAQATLLDVRGKDGSGTLENPVTDSSDPNYQTYVVRKLADGNCWMIQNLNMTLSTTITLDETTTDLSPGRTFTPERDTQTTAGTTWTQTGTEGSRSFEPGENIYFANGVGTGTLNTDVYNYSGYLSSGEPYWHIGNYYNWYAATAGTGLASSPADFIAPSSICPVNWALPDNSGSKSFYNLVLTTYGLVDNNATASNTILLQAPLNFVRSGHYDYGSGRQRGRGYNGHWWSTTTRAATTSYILKTHPSRVIPQTYYGKGHGFSIRCVAR